MTRVQCCGVISASETSSMCVCQDNKEEARAIVMRLLQIGVQVLTSVGPCDVTASFCTHGGCAHFMKATQQPTPCSSLHAWCSSRCRLATEQGTCMPLPAAHTAGQ